MPIRISDADIIKLLADPQDHTVKLEDHVLAGMKPYSTVRAKNQPASKQPSVQTVDVLIAGSGPIASAYARTIHDYNEKNNTNFSVLVADIGSQDDPVIGAHHKNSIKYQRDIDSFVNVIKGALQPLSVPPQDTNITTLGGDGWQPNTKQMLVFQGHNPVQDPRVNLKAQAVTRTVGGMATHWTAACPYPIAEERTKNPINSSEFDTLLGRARKLLNVHTDEYDYSMRHTVVKNNLLTALDKDGSNPRNIQNLPLAVKRRDDNPDYVTWTGANTVLGDTFESDNFTLWSQTRVTKLVMKYNSKDTVAGALVRRMDTNDDVLVVSKVVIVACGAVCTPQILANSDILPAALGRNACEQSIAFCQIVLKYEIIQSIRDTKDPEWQKRINRHQEVHPNDPLRIPFNDPEPQVMIPCTTKFPWHCQIHRDAFSYGDVGPRADARTVVDLRFFGRQDVNWDNRVYFGKDPEQYSNWVAGVTDIYGMPQPTFEVTRGPADVIRDHEMMADMTAVANTLGAFLPGSTPQFMEPGLALHLTGTTRIGTDSASSVANPSSIVHGFKNLWVGGNGCIPDSTACNPTLTSLAIALKGADAVIEYLKA